MSKRIGTTLTDREYAWLKYRAIIEKRKESEYIRAALLSAITKRVPIGKVLNEDPPDLSEYQEESE